MDITGEERILQGIAQKTDFRVGQKFNFYYNESVYPDYVLLDQKNSDAFLEIFAFVGFFFLMFSLYMIHYLIIKVIFQKDMASSLLL